MKQIAFNLHSSGVAKCINAHYGNAGWTDFIRYPNPLPHLAVMIVRPKNEIHKTEPHTASSQP